MKKTNKKIIAIVSAITVAVTTLSTVCVCSAHLDNSTETKPTVKASAKAPVSNNKFVYTVSGQGIENNYDWNYWITALNVDVDCDFDHTTGNYNFEVTGLGKGYVNVQFQYKISDTTWKYDTLHFYVDDNKNIKRIDNIIESETREKGVKKDSSIDYSINVTSINDKLYAGDTCYYTIQAKPYTTYNATFVPDTIKGTVVSMGTVTTDANGYASGEFHIWETAIAGRGTFTISDDNHEVKTPITVLNNSQDEAITLTSINDKLQPGETCYTSFHAKANTTYKMTFKPESIKGTVVSLGTVTTDANGYANYEFHI
ncbi:MAG: hypothetical protein MJ197_10795, partial [Bacteroidales bacterium]|nr:hypothetical protein [Bacteroidales bacterium]